MACVWERSRESGLDSRPGMQVAGLTLLLQWSLVSLLSANAPPAHTEQIQSQLVCTRSQIRPRYRSETHWVSQPLGGPAGDEGLLWKCSFSDQERPSVQNRRVISECADCVLPSHHALVCDQNCKFNSVQDFINTVKLYHEMKHLLCMSFWPPVNTN